MYEGQRRGVVVQEKISELDVWFGGFVGVIPIRESDAIVDIGDNNENVGWCTKEYVIMFLDERLDILVVEFKDLPIVVRTLIIALNRPRIVSVLYNWL